MQMSKSVSPDSKKTKYKVQIMSYWDHVQIQQVAVQRIHCERGVALTTLPFSNCTQHNTKKYVNFLPCFLVLHHAFQCIVNKNTDFRCVLFMSCPASCTTLLKPKRLLPKVRLCPTHTVSCCALHLWKSNYWQRPDLILQTLCRVYMWKGQSNYVCFLTNLFFQAGLIN